MAFFNFKKNIQNPLSQTGGQLGEAGRDTTKYKLYKAQTDFIGSQAEEQARRQQEALRAMGLSSRNIGRIQDQADFAAAIARGDIAGGGQLAAEEAARRADAQSLAAAASATGGSGLARRAATQAMAMEDPRQRAAIRQAQLADQQQASQLAASLGGQAGQMALQGMQQGTQLGQQYLNEYLRSAGMTGQAQQGMTALELQGLAATLGDRSQRQQLLQQQEAANTNLMMQMMGQGSSAFGGMLAAAPMIQAANQPGPSTYNPYDPNQAGSMLPQYSDRDVKTDVQGADMDQFLGRLRPATYRYNKEGRKLQRRLGSEAEGRQVGVMAQDLEKSDVGRSMVSENAEGRKKVDVGKAAMASLAANAYLKDRIDQLEGALGAALAPVQAEKALRDGFEQHRPLKALYGPVTEPGGRPQPLPIPPEHQKVPHPLESIAAGPATEPDRAEASFREGFRQYNPTAALFDQQALENAALASVAAQQSLTNQDLAAENAALRGRAAGDPFGVVQGSLAEPIATDLEGQLRTAFERENPLRDVLSQVGPKGYRR